MVIKPVWYYHIITINKTQWNRAEWLERDLYIHDDLTYDQNDYVMQ